MKKILFISWDGPQTSYMEGLFMPIFQEVSKNSSYEFHVIQCTWGTKERIANTEKSALQLGVKYRSFPISRKPTSTIGSALTVLKAIPFIKKYIQENEIQIVMPRSTFPVIMLNMLNFQNFKVLFDADGLAIEERVDFAGLRRESFMYRFLKKEETKMMKKSHGVITRSHKAIAFHLDRIGQKYKAKFSVVYNGRDSALFKPNIEKRNESRKELGLQDNEKLFVYCGSLGPQYGWNEMMAIFKDYLKLEPASRFLILTGSPEYARNRMPEELSEKMIIKKVPFEKIPFYLNAADFAFAIREPKPSMQGVAPIKIGEYLLMGLPVIASKGIGDSETILNETSACFVYDHNDTARVEKAIQFLQKPLKERKTEIREIGIKYFSLEKSAESYINALDKL